MLRVMLERVERRTGVITTAQSADTLTHNLCVYCMTNPANTIDHVISIVCDGRLSGYGNTPDNLVPCCSSCNSSKGSRKWDQWMLRKFGDNEITKDRISVIASIVGKAERRHYVQSCDDDSKAMYSALKRRCYQVCSILHVLSSACGDDPSQWKNHVNAFDFSIQGVERYNNDEKNEPNCTSSLSDDELVQPGNASKVRVAPA